MAGNASMKEQRFSDAIQFYTLAISFCNDNAIFYANRCNKNVQCLHLVVGFWCLYCRIIRNADGASFDHFLVAYAFAGQQHIQRSASLQRQ